MGASLTYAIKFVADMESAVRFHSSQLGLRLRFKSPEWTEFETGQTTLALHLASRENPPGSCELGFNVEDIDAFCAGLARQGVPVLEPPRDLHGHRIAKLQGPDGAAFSVSGRPTKKT
jgi:lactoylglutathione lyase